MVENRILFNLDKFYFAENEEEFSGFLITANGVRPTKKMAEVILQLSTPAKIKGIRSLFGLVSQVSNAFSQAEVIAPFWELLRKF